MIVATFRRSLSRCPQSLTYMQSNFQMSQMKVEEATRDRLAWRGSNFCRSALLGSAEKQSRTSSSYSVENRLWVHRKKTIPTKWLDKFSQKPLRNRLKKLHENFVWNEMKETWWTISFLNVYKQSSSQTKVEERKHFLPILVPLCVNEQLRNFFSKQKKMLREKLIFYSKKKKKKKSSIPVMITNLILIENKNKVPASNAFAMSFEAFAVKSSQIRSAGHEEKSFWSSFII